MSDDADRGFTLLEMVCVLAIIAMMAAVLLPLIPHQTSRSRLQAYALQTAALLKADRNAAIWRQADVGTLVDAGTRSIRSGATTDMIRIPDDVRFDALLPQTCNRRAALSTTAWGFARAAVPEASDRLPYRSHRHNGSRACRVAS